jgi:hypothetical protein
LSPDLPSVPQISDNLDIKSKLLATLLPLWKGLYSCIFLTYTEHV